MSNGTGLGRVGQASKCKGTVLVGGCFPLRVSPSPYWNRSGARNASGASMATKNTIRGAKKLAMARPTKLRWPAGQDTRRTETQ